MALDFKQRLQIDQTALDIMEGVGIWAHDLTPQLDRLVADGVVGRARR